MEDIKEQVLKLCEVLDDKKAKDIIAINVADRTIVAEWFVICTGRVSAQVKAICDAVDEKGPEFGLSKLRLEGYQQARWIVMDFGHILLHIFHPEERTYYNMERLWMDDEAKVIRYSELQKSEE